MNITFVTGNENKRREVAAILNFPELKNVKIDLPEKQSMDLQQIIEDKIRVAYGLVGEPVLVEDISYEIEAVNGFPGPFVKFWEKAGLHDAVLANIEQSGSNKARIVCAVAYKDSDRELIVLETLYGQHVARTDGQGWGFDFYFVPNGETETFAQMGPERKNQISHRRLAFTALKEKLRLTGINL